MSVEAYFAARRPLLRGRRAPDARPPVPDCGYQPMVELLRYLEAHGFTHVHRLRRRPRLHAPDRASRSTGSRPSGSSAVELRPRVPRGRRRRGRLQVAGWSSSTTARRSRCGSGAGSGGGRRSRRQLQRRRPDAAVRRTALRLLVLHDDAEREFDYTPARNRRSRPSGLDDVSVKDDWATVFADAP